MPKKEETTSKIEIDSDLIESAEAYLAKLPETPAEVIEHWTYLGMAAARQLAEYEQLMLMSGSGKLSIKETET